MNVKPKFVYYDIRRKQADSNPEPDLTVSDTLEMLSEMGVDTDD